MDRGKRMRIAINKGYGRFRVSEIVRHELGIENFAPIGNKTFGIISKNIDAYRSYPKLIKAIEKVGVKEAGDLITYYKIIKVPNGVKWEIVYRDGYEIISEVHREWS